MNIRERPEGIRIASFFIVTMIATSLLSRALRSTELRITAVEMDELAVALIAEDEDKVIRVVARRPRPETEADLDDADRWVRKAHNIDANEPVYFLEIEKRDASEFEETLQVNGERLGKNRVLRARSPVVANAIAAVLIHVQKMTGNVPHGYFKWREGNPVGNLFRFLFLGEGDTAPVTHEVLRRAIPDEPQRPVVHVA
jgi:hypothetical protein